MSDPFAVLGLEPQFDLDAELLQSAFLRASAQCHPDRFTDPLEQAEAAERMSHVTQAHRVLRDPELRAGALLALSGMSDEADAQSLPPTLLMDMMEVRETMEQAVAQSDFAKLDDLRQWANAKREGHLMQIAKLFAKPMDSVAAKSIRLELNALRYIARMIEQMPDEGAKG